MLRGLILGIAIMAIILASSHAFTTPPRISTTPFSTTSTTAVGLFGLFGKDEQDPKATTTSKVGSKSKPNEEAPKPPFTFKIKPGYGKFDWVKGKEEERKSEAFSWSNKPPRTTPSKK